MEYIKKYWFVALVAVLFVGAIAFFAVEEDKNTFKGKVVNGEDVMFEYNGIDVTANELFDEVFEDESPILSQYFVQFGLFNNSMETTDELKQQAKEASENAITYYKYNYGSDYLDYLLPTLRTYGYSSIDQLQDYFIAYFKMVKYQTDYYLNKYWDEFSSENNPRILSHILVKCADSENPTEEEKAKMAQVDEALKTKDFAEVAKEFSDDTSASEGGDLGYSDKTNNNYVTEFADASYTLADGEVSDWVKTTYGYHKIKCMTTKKEDLKDNEDFFKALSDTYAEDQQILKQLYEQHKVDYHGYTNIQEYIEKTLLTTDDEEVNE